MVASLHPDISKVYGQFFFKTAEEAIIAEDDVRLLEDLTPVCETMEHALFAKRPRSHYQCGMGSSIIMWIATHMPTFIADFVSTTATGTLVPQGALATITTPVETSPPPPKDIGPPANQKPKKLNRVTIDTNHVTTVNGTGEISTTV